MPDLKIGVIIAVFYAFGKTPWVKDWLNIFVRGESTEVVRSLMSVSYTSFAFDVLRALIILSARLPQQYFICGTMVLQHPYDYV